jgi:hypothetical protein
MKLEDYITAFGHLQTRLDNLKENMLADIRAMEEAMTAEATEARRAARIAARTAEMEANKTERDAFRAQRVAGRGKKPNDNPK